jgi:hypothetical protein
MKLQTVVLAIALLASACAPAYARPAAHFASSHSFSRGFSSSHTAPANTHPALPAPSRPRTGFGSFGGAAPTDSAPRSALGSQLGRQAAQDNALRTLDQRRAPAQAPEPVRSERSAAVQPAPMIVVQQRSGVGDMLMGYMLGRAASGHAAGYYPPPAVPDQTGAGASLLRIFLWLLALSAVCWTIYWLVRRRRAARQARTANYTFERD